MADELPASPELQHAIEQWYYREARLLDGREYQKWLTLCAPEIRYVMPGRGNPLVDNARRGNEDMISVERELEGAVLGAVEEPARIGSGRPAPVFLAGEVPAAGHHLIARVHHRAGFVRGDDPRARRMVDAGRVEEARAWVQAT